VVQRRIRVAELRVVQDVERLDADLGVDVSEPRVLDERGVDVDLPRPTNDAASRVAEGPGRVGRGREARSVNPLVDGRIAEGAVAGPVRPVGRGGGGRA